MAPVGEPLSPEWWLHRLEEQLKNRLVYVDLMDRYYSGDHPLPRTHERAAEHFKRMLVQSRANWTGLVVDAVAERLHVDGFRLDEDEADKDAWQLWQRNNLDAESELVHVEALVAGESYVTVWRNEEDPETPLIMPESSREMIVALMPGNHREVAAALKMWEDDWTGDTNATLYLPDKIWKYRRRNTGPWEPRDGESIDNDLGVVPVVPFRNRPRLGIGGRSEIEDVIDIQARIDKTLLDRMMASEYAAFRQRWATGMEIPVNELNQPIEPFKSAVDRLWVAEDPDTKFGEFGATDLTPYIKAVEADVQHIAAITRTPPHYLLGQIVNVSGDALKAAEAGLSSKAASKTRHFGESWERVMRLAFAVLDDPRAKVTDGETIWASVETRTEGELVDALVKMKTLGVPNEALWERWGATQAEIDRWQEIALQDELARQAMDVTALAMPGQRPGGPPSVPPGAPGPQQPPGQQPPARPPR